jgi:hypothetical protein
MRKRQMDTTIKFLRAVLGDLGHYCIVAIKGTKRIQTFYSTIDSAVEAAIKADADGFDAYYGLATFKTDESRTNGNVEQMRSFYLDLDCGASKDYPDQQAALNDLRRFCKELHLPRPSLVNSGRGIHVYWTLTEPVTREIWLPVAERLKALCKEQNFLADPVVTADSARILRVPGTRNHKDTPPKPVDIVGHEAPPVTFDSFKAILGDDPFKEAPRMGGADRSAVAEALMGNYISRFKTIMQKTAKGEGCEQLKIAYTKQEEISEPLWRSALSVAAFCEDAEESVHKLSFKHPNYSYDETIKKVALIKGPYRCMRFDEINEGVCPNCPHWAGVKANPKQSPIFLGREIKEATEADNVVEVPPEFTEEEVAEDGTVNHIPYQIPTYPKPYFRGAAGGIYKRTRDEDGTYHDNVVYHHDFYVVKRVRDPEYGESVVTRLHLPHDGVREFTVPLAAVTSKDEFKRILATNGIVLMKPDDMMGYVTGWVNELQMKTVAEEARRQFGWTHNMESFVLGDREIFPDREVHNPISAATRDLYPHLTKKGTLEGWKQTMEFYNRKGFEAYQFMTCIGFGSILMELTPINGMQYHFHSKDSGLGKTTAMIAMMSIWGDGEKLLSKQRDTHNSKMNRAEVLKNLPLALDELTNGTPQECSDTSYEISSGQQRNRLSSRGNNERYRGIPWKLIVPSTGNAGLIERISLYKMMPRAEAMRIYEHRATKIIFKTKAETDEFSRALKENYGHAGPIFVQYVMKNLDKVRQMVEEIQRRIDIAAGLLAEHRYWSAGFACTIAGSVIASKLGLIGYDTKNLFHWAVSDLRKAAERVLELADDPTATVGEYVDENINNILRIKQSIDLRRGDIGDGGVAEQIIQPDGQGVRGNLLGRYEYDVKKLYLAVKPFRSWCVKHQINFAATVDSLKASNGAVTKKVRLAKGTHMNILPVACVVMDVDLDAVTPDPTFENETGV